MTSRYTSVGPDDCMFVQYFLSCLLCSHFAFLNMDLMGIHFREAKEARNSMEKSKRKWEQTLENREKGEAKLRPMNALPICCGRLCCAGKIHTSYLRDMRRQYLECDTQANTLNHSCDDCQCFLHHFGIDWQLFLKCRWSESFFNRTQRYRQPNQFFHRQRRRAIVLRVAHSSTGCQYHIAEQCGRNSKGQEPSSCQQNAQDRWPTYFELPLLFPCRFSWFSNLWRFWKLCRSCSIVWRTLQQVWLCGNFSARLKVVPDQLFPKCSIFRKMHVSP